MITAIIQRFDVEGELQALAGPDVRAQILADAARDILVQTDAENAAAIGTAIPHRTVVDGVPTEDLERVHAEGLIARTYDLMPAVLLQIGNWLWQHSPVRSGRYQHSHRLEADGEGIAAVTEGWSLPGLSPNLKEFTFLSTVHYAPLIEPHGDEPGESRQAPDGVYQVIALLAKEMFAGIATITFEYRGIEPAIIVRPNDA
ncbi:hypothetical protein [Bradyrhizobium sp. BR 10261]|uniref:hypothetical protein n=1 Tax=Bradyrhizobium sp. BR 10261 TaxID=2749992 RepID=UPI001C64B7A3|nr:hypothetical protein [Bradyrhizobium sp. BR 10261]MBW7965315.1 hypothetical protein [Bradyrhizobium sp. BR 10261]